MDFSDLLTEDSITWEQQVDEENEFNGWFDLFENYYPENSALCDQHPSSDDSYELSPLPNTFPEIHNPSAGGEDLNHQEPSSNFYLETNEDVPNISWTKLDVELSNKNVEDIWNMSKINPSVENLENSSNTASKYFNENAAIPCSLEDTPIISTRSSIFSNSVYANKINEKKNSSRIQYSPYEAYNSPRHEIRANQPTMLTNLHLKYKETAIEEDHTQLLVLPNGEVYKKILLPLDNKTAIGQKWNLNTNVVDLSFKLQNNGLNNLGSQPPSPNSDSGVSTISWSPQTQSEDCHQFGSQISAQSKLLDPPSYTLNEVLFANPQPHVGVLLLTDEEKSTLLMEGYPIPYELPLDKHQEKYLKKIRRKIKNKISAQESRRKKKEYADSLESKMRMYQRENVDLIKKVECLENNNRTLLSQLQMIQNKVHFARPKNGGACFMVLVVFFAVFVGSWDFTSINFGYNKLLTSTGPVQHFTGRPGLGPNLPLLERSSLESSQKILGLGPNIQEPVVENYFKFNGQTVTKYCKKLIKRVKSWWMFTNENDTTTDLELEILPLPPGALTGDAIRENVRLNFESHPTVPAAKIVGNDTLPAAQQFHGAMGTGCN